MKILADMHTHTTFSVDGKDDLMSVCQAAIAKDIKYICFSEHLDLNPGDEGYGYFRFDEFSKTIDHAREYYGDRLVILKGLEFGEPHLYPKELEEMNHLDFDLILGSIHWLDAGFVGSDELRETRTPRELYTQYYEQVLEMVKVGGFDVLAHFDFPKRYLKDSTDLPDLINEILKETVKAGIVLEINTSPLRKGLTECAPDLLNLKRYLENGGSKLTVGSDAHYASQIAANFDDAAKLIQKAGGVQVGIFEKRIFKPIETEG